MSEFPQLDTLVKLLEDLHEPYQLAKDFGDEKRVLELSEQIAELYEALEETGIQLGEPAVEALAHLLQHRFAIVRFAAENALDYIHTPTAFEAISKWVVVPKDEREAEEQRRMKFLRDRK